MAFDPNNVYGPYFFTPAVLTTVGMVGTTALVAEDYTRVLLILWLATAQNVTVSTRPNVLANNGMILTPNAPSIILSVWDHGPIVGQAWFAAAGAATAVEVMVVQRRIDPELLAKWQREAIANVTDSTPPGNGGDNGHGAAGAQPTASWADPERAPQRGVRNLIYGPGGPWEWDQDTGGYSWAGDVGGDERYDREGAGPGDQ